MTRSLLTQYNPSHHSMPITQIRLPSANHFIAASFSWTLLIILHGNCVECILHVPNQAALVGNVFSHAFSLKALAVLIFCHENTPALMHLPLLASSSNCARFRMQCKQMGVTGLRALEWKQTDTHTDTDGTENITSSANAGGKYWSFVICHLFVYGGYVAIWKRNTDITFYS